MNHVFLLLGTNLGNRSHNLTHAIEELKCDVGSIQKQSSVYETAAWGKTDQPEFYNQVVEINTLLEPQKLLQSIKTIETKLGRERTVKWGERIIDIDILLFGDICIETESLTIPHPQLANRKFTLIPLAEIAATAVHPILQKKISLLLDECADPLDVRKIE